MLVLTAGISLASLNQQAHASTNTSTIVPNINDPAYINSVLPGAISDSDQALMERIALANVQVKDALAGKSYEFMSTSYLTENVMASPVHWDPVTHLNVANNTELAVIIDMQSETAKSVISGPLTTACTGDCLHHTWADNWVGNVGSTPNYLDVQSTAPSYTRNHTPIHGGQSLYLNGMMLVSDDNLLCTSADYYSDYWNQVGFNWDTSSDTTLVYTDTKLGCINQLSGMTYTSGHNYKFEVNGNTNNPSTHKGWTVAGIDLNTFVAFTNQFNYDVRYSGIRYSDLNTGVFFENRESQASEPNWDTNFASNPTATAAHYSTNGGSTVSNWPTSTTEDTTCSGGTTTPSAVMGSTNLQSGGTATWTKHTMYTNLPAC
jgi:hypothetical protein